MPKSNNPALFFGAILVAILALVLAIYYAVPGVYHVLVSGSHPPMESQPSHTLLFAVVTVLAIIAALVTRPKSSR